MRILHISGSKRSEGVMGGVEKFAWYLQRAVGCDIKTPGDLFKKEDYDTVIGDGFYVESFDPGKQRVISVIHGSWKEFAIRNNKPEFFSGAERQGKIWQDPLIEKVAVSKSAAKYAKIHHGINVDKIILNGVDTELFKPGEKEKHERPVVIHDARDYNKSNHGKIEEIERLLPEFEFRPLRATIGEEHIKIQEGDIFLSASRYEGCAFVLLEAMSCGMPVVATKCGLFEDTIFEPSVGIICPWEAPPMTFAKGLKTLWKERDEFLPREWILKNASFEIFKKKWTEYINAI